MCQGFSYFTVFLHHFVLTKLATSWIRVNSPSVFLQCMLDIYIHYASFVLGYIGFNPHAAGDFNLANAK